MWLWLRKITTLYYQYWVRISAIIVMMMMIIITLNLLTGCYCEDTVLLTDSQISLLLPCCLIFIMIMTDQSRSSWSFYWPNPALISHLFDDWNLLWVWSWFWSIPMIALMNISLIIVTQTFTTEMTDLMGNLLKASWRPIQHLCLTILRAVIIEKDPK